MAGVYIHIPFCRALCSYCNFYFSLSEQRKEQMFRALMQEIELSSSYFDDSQKVTTLYIGGGTPSLFSADMLGALMERVAEVFSVERFEEVTVETNPDDLTEDFLLGLSKTRCSRLSIGIQSLNDYILRFLNRRHDSRGAIESVERAKKAGFNNITLDLMYGIPHQSEEMLISDIKELISLEPTHLSAYHLTIEERSLLYKQVQRGEITPVDESVSERHFSIVSHMLQEAGYEHYEVSNFAKDGFRAVHNANYWKSVPYLGIGPSAHSFDGKNSRRWNFASNQKYLRAISGGERYFEGESLTQTDRLNEEIMTLLRTSDGADLEQLALKYTQKSIDKVIYSAKPFVNSENLIFDGKIMRIDPSNFLKSDYIISSLFV